MNNGNNYKSHRASLVEEQSFYQNVGGQSGSVAALSEAVAQDLFHASPRVAGTPMGPSSGGPEKPQRQYSYAGINEQQQQQQHHMHQRKEVHFSDESSAIPNNVSGATTANRVRFQEEPKVSTRPPLMEYDEEEEEAVDRENVSVILSAKDLDCK